MPIARLANISIEQSAVYRHARQFRARLHRVGWWSVPKCGQATRTRVPLACDHGARIAKVLQLSIQLTVAYRFVRILDPAALCVCTVGDTMCIIGITAYRGLRDAEDVLGR